MSTLQFQSKLHTSRAELWSWMSSARGINFELGPWMRMTIPKGVRNWTDVKVAPGKPLFRSFVLLLGFIPFDYSDLTLIEFREGEGFLEQSPMAWMKLWRHERRIQESLGEPGVMILTDMLTFEPRMMKSIIRGIVQQVFQHRHRRLRKHFGEAGHSNS
jgi:hypothetical protein